MKEFENIINTAWDNRESINGQSDQSILDAIKETIELVDKGTLRVAEKKDNEWVVHQWIKKAILLSFKTNEMQTLAGPYATWWDKVRGKTAGWGREEHKKAGFRMVPNGVVRHGSFIAKNVVLMPSFVNIGAYVDEGTMVDTWASVGSCAQIGKNCHISGGAGIGGVLEPMQANPTIVEDNCFLVLEIALYTFFNLLINCFSFIFLNEVKLNFPSTGPTLSLKLTSCPKA